MEKVTIYEYYIDGDKVIKMEQEAEWNGIYYKFWFGKNRNRIKLYADELEKPSRNRIFSLTDNIEYYREILINCFESRVQKEEERVISQKKILETLKTTH